MVGEACKKVKVRQHTSGILGLSKGTLYRKYPSCFLQLKVFSKISGRVAVCLVLIPMFVFTVGKNLKKTGLKLWVFPCLKLCTVLSHTAYTQVYLLFPEYSHLIQIGYSDIGVEAVKSRTCNKKKYCILLPAIYLHRDFL